MTELMRDVRHATRRLVRTPMFTLATLLTLALGIGANVAIFSIVNTVLLKPLPFHEPDRIVAVTNFWTRTGLHPDQAFAGKRFKSKADLVAR